MDDFKVDAYVAANLDNFWSNYDNNWTRDIFESDGETFVRALIGPNNRFRLAEEALSDMDSAGQLIPNEFAANGAASVTPFAHRYNIEQTSSYNIYPVSNPSPAPTDDTSKKWKNEIKLDPQKQLNCHYLFKKSKNFLFEAYNLISFRLK